jgi:hypothetical protein
MNGILFFLACIGIVIFLVALRLKGTNTRGGNERSQNENGRNAARSRIWPKINWDSLIFWTVVPLAFGIVFLQCVFKPLRSCEQYVHERDMGSRADPRRRGKKTRCTGIRKEGDILKVSARCGWQGSGLRLRQGQYLTIQAWGKTYCSEDSVTHFRGSADGPEGMSDEHRQLVRVADYPVSSANPHGLVAKVGGGKPFFIGTGGTFKSHRTGELYLRINDYRTSDNRGSLSVKVRSR